MSKTAEIETTSRVKAGKGAARAIRRSGLVPGVVYGGKKEPELISVDPRIIFRELQSPGWRSRVYAVKTGQDTQRALIRDVQWHPVKDLPLHIDFLRLAKGARVTVEVAVNFVGEDESPGVKRGGVLNVVQHTIDVEVDADHIPQSFTVDLSNLDINDNVRWEDVKDRGEAVPVTNEPNFVIASVAPPSSEPTVDEEAEEAGETPEEAEEKEAEKKE